MGIDANGEAFLRHAKAKGVTFERTCTLGRQERTMHGMTGLVPVYADDLFRNLGATALDVIDYSDYQGAEIVHDLNDPEPPKVAQRYTVVLDGGSLEHIFHLPNGLRSLMSLLDVGGHLLFITPTDGHSGHGFYQFSPELFYRALSPENGFEMVDCLYREVGRPGWFSVPDPAVTGERVQPKARSSALLHVIAKKVADVEPFAQAPLQSDYVTLWESGAETSPHRKLEKIPKILHPLALRTKVALDTASMWAALPRRGGLSRVQLRD